jgi:hypothetical protein
MRSWARRAFRSGSSTSTRSNLSTARACSQRPEPPGAASSRWRIITPGGAGRRGARGRSRRGNSGAQARSDRAAPERSVRGPARPVRHQRPAHRREGPESCRGPLAAGGRAHRRRGRFALSLYAVTRPPAAGASARLTRQGPARCRPRALAPQCSHDRPGPPRRDLVRSSRPACAIVLPRPPPGPSGGVPFPGRPEPDARSPRFRQADGDGLLRRPRAMLASADMPHLLTDELAGLGTRRFSPVPGPSSALDRSFLWHHSSSTASAVTPLLGVFSSIHALAIRTPCFSASAWLSNRS